MNLLKRLESSVHSFALTLQKVRDICADAIAHVDEYRTGGAVATVSDAAGFDLDADDADEPVFEVGGKTRFEIADLDYVSWRVDMQADLETLDLLVSMVADITPEVDTKLADLVRLIEDKVAHPLNPGNRKIIVFAAFADTAAYLYENVAPRLKGSLGMDSYVITGNATPSSTLEKPKRDMNTLLTFFSLVFKERDTLMPGDTRAIDLLIVTDCISEGQNLQDCDFLVNYDIHWNPVRIVQRFGRIDRIGARNEIIQLVNFWPDAELDEYIRLQARVEERMRMIVMTSTGDDDLVNENEKGDLEYRERQLHQMQEDVVDLEDVSGGVFITDLVLGDFRMDLLEHHKHNSEIDGLPHGLHAVVSGDEAGMIFVLRNVASSVGARSKNQLHPFYLVYVREDGSVLHGHLDPKDVLHEMRLLCCGKSEPDPDLCAAFNRDTKDGRDMGHVSGLLGDAIASIIDARAERDVDSFFTGGTTSFLEGDVAGCTSDTAWTCSPSPVPRWMRRGTASAPRSSSAIPTAMPSMPV